MLANFGVLLALLCGHIVQRIFFGSLRPNEVEVCNTFLFFHLVLTTIIFLSVYMIGYGFSSQSLSWHSLYSETSLIRRLPLCLDFFYSLNPFIGWLVIALNGYDFIFASLTFSNFSRWTKGHIQDRRCRFTSEWQSSLLFYGQQTASCFYLQLSTHWLPGWVVWCYSLAK